MIPLLLDMHAVVKSYMFKTYRHHTYLQNLPRSACSCLSGFPKMNIERSTRLQEVAAHVAKSMLCYLCHGPNVFLWYRTKYVVSSINSNSEPDIHIFMSPVLSPSTWFRSCACDPVCSSVYWFVFAVIEQLRSPWFYPQSFHSWCRCNADPILVVLHSIPRNSLWFISKSCTMRILNQRTISTMQKIYNSAFGKHKGISWLSCSNSAGITVSCS